MARFGKVVFNVVSVICLAAFIVLALLASPMLAKYYPVASYGSMTPMYPAGSLTYYKSADFNNINAGNFITYYSSGSDSYATERVISADNGKMEFTTNSKSDGSGVPSTVSYTLVKGKVISRYIPYVAYFTQFVQTYSFVLIIAAVILLARVIVMAVSKGKKAKFEEILVDDFSTTHGKNNITYFETSKPPVITRASLDEQENLPSEPGNNTAHLPPADNATPPSSNDAVPPAAEEDEPPVFANEFKPMYTPPVVDTKPKRGAQYSLKHGR